MALDPPLSRRVLGLPGVRSWYGRNAARVKLEACLILEASAGEALPNELTTGEVRLLIDDLAAMGVRRLVVSGGEPLVRADVVDLMGYARHRGLSIGLVSNGYLVDERWQELSSLEYFLYFTSIDGPGELHDRSRRLAGSFDRALAGLTRFAEIGTPARLVNTVVHPGNLDVLPELLEVIRSSSATRWHLTPAAKVGRAAGSDAFSLNGRQLRELVDFVRSARSVVDVDLGEAHTYLGCFDGLPPGNTFFCGAGLTRCSIMPEGSVLACQQVYDLRKAEGNIREQPFSKIWREGFREIRRRRPPEHCIGCAHLSACQGGCWAERELHGDCLKPLWDSAGEPSSAHPGTED